MDVKLQYSYKFNLDSRNNFQSKIEMNIKLEGIKWGIFCDSKDDTHVIPVDIDGNNFERHALNSMCLCNPILKESEENDVRFMFVHNLKRIR